MGYFIRRICHVGSSSAHSHTPAGYGTGGFMLQKITACSATMKRTGFLLYCVSMARMSSYEEEGIPYKKGYRLNTRSNLSTVEVAISWIAIYFSLCFLLTFFCALKTHRKQ